MFQYQAYDLEVDSELELVELEPSRRVDGAEPDVKIRFAPVPTELAGATHSGALWQAHPNRFLLDMRDVARFLVIDGVEVQIERYAGASDADIGVLIGGSMFAALLQQRQFVTLHASSVLTDSGAAIFMGASGVGKSTLMSALVQRGFTMLADDLTALRRNSAGLIEAVSASPSTRLWADSVDKLGRKQSDGLRVRGLINKYSMPVAEFRRTVVRPSQLFILVPSSEASDVTVEKMSASESFRCIRNSTYRKSYMKGLGLSGFHFGFIDQLIKAIDVNRIVRPRSPMQIEKLTDIVTANISSGPEV